MRYSAITSAANTLKRTPLFDWHVSRGGQMVPFAGWAMPLQYKGVGQVDAHHHTRNHAGLFDVSHMQQIVIKQSPHTHSSFIHSILPIAHTQPLHTSAYSLILTDTGAIIDDCILTKWRDDEYYLVTNASRAQRVREWLEGHKMAYEKRESTSSNSSNSVVLKYLESHSQALLALQGPSAAAVLENHSDVSLKDLHFGRVKQHLRLSGGAVVHLARSGYTGEDGFEVSVEQRDAVQVADMLADTVPTMPIGLGARDSLRLEAGMCLYGNDLWEGESEGATTPTTPAAPQPLSVGEAGLAWTIAKDRRTREQETLFPGWDKVVPSLKVANMQIRRVGLVIEKGAAARSNSIIEDAHSGASVGWVTSGAPSPTLNQNIAMGYVSKELSAVGTPLIVNVRGRQRRAEVVKMPFVASNYYRASE
ncbi:hypothetical protein E3P98_01585 [Wallemia ichthyophaga]|nr:hypothetical protein E3P98_01585 [Wallemia ichthyophaga]